MYELKIIKNYAKALFKNSAIENIEEDILKQMLAISDIFNSNKKLYNVMCSPVIQNTVKDKVLQALLSTSKIHEIVERFLYILIRKSRFNLLQLIADEYSSMFSNSKGIKYAELVSASKLDNKEVAKVQKYLEHQLEKVIKIKTKVDHNLIGGMIIKYDSNLIDFSVRGAINRVEKTAKEVQI